MIDMTESTAQVRSVLLSLIPGVGEPFLVMPSPDEVAARSGVPVEDVEAIMAHPDAVLDFLIEPLGHDVRQALEHIPIRRSPTLDEQRELLTLAMQACVRNPNQIRLLLLLVDRLGPPLGNRLTDSFIHATGTRLVGIDHDGDPVIRQRVAMVGELLCVAAVSHRHSVEEGTTSAESIEAVVDACLGILHPPTD